MFSGPTGTNSCQKDKVEVFKVDIIRDHSARHVGHVAVEEKVEVSPPSRLGILYSVVTHVSVCVLPALVLDLSVPDLFLFWICSAKYSTALHNIFNIFEKVQKKPFLTHTVIILT